MGEYNKDHNLTAAVDQKTFTAVDNLARESFMSKSMLINHMILKFLHDDPNVPKTTSRLFSIRILRERTAQIKENLRIIDEFYDFKVDLWQICMLLNGKIGNISEHGVAKCGMEDLISLISSIRVDEPRLFEECIPILRKTLNRAQINLILEQSKILDT